MRLLSAIAICKDYHQCLCCIYGLNTDIYAMYLTMSLVFLEIRVGFKIEEVLLVNLQN